ncbi:hypothetical protein UNOSLW4_0130 [Pseudomonas phage UNO-SLW4]|uniref:HNS binding protein n=5 Tax=Unosvirus TaxID=3424968 RepID=A0A1B2AN25_9CAUD|nr:Gp5.5-like host HNS inhibition [Pseudomonas phage UNO-SLW1]ANY29041.1 hypothetical protein UNOSLW4_0130 [Pseudomonas phage UNO-SLW4]ANY29088.1 hypothetical protein UNOSLW3_0135 [Pseudomonas phage UNO-SLW3]ANY29134.1 hypothetical protein UNOSLW2_0130 [Pseudomonas phage UNO-SLW2]UBU95722.1 hypothetical protein [Pseudomonas phage PCS4]UPW35220.1 hypothetical protein [Pseudomonas phage PCS5]WCD55498.1 hypothetical protein ALHIHJMA_00001 [Pseudomonas phage phi C106]
MAKTLKANVSFGLTCVVNTDAEKALEAARDLARVALKHGEAPKGEQGAMLSLFASEKPTEELLEIIIRKGVRELVREELDRELNTDETRATIGNIKVDFEVRE